MELRVLGPLEVRHDGSSVVLHGSKPRELLALLALRPNQPVSPDELADQLWEGSGPPSAPTALRVHIGRVRQALEPSRRANVPSSRLPLGPQGYVLRIDPDELDAQRFERHVVLGRDANAQGDPRSAVMQLTAGPDLWRGPAFSGARDLAPMAAEIARLDGLRVNAVEELADARLVLGEHALVVDVLHAALEEFPLHEELTAQFMRASYRCGRQADALRAYAELARRLDDQLGVAPSHRLRELENDVLLQSPRLDFVPPRPAPQTAPSDPRGSRVRFVGRRRELGRLLEIEADSEVDGPRFVLVNGEAGMGKSSLVEEFSRRVPPGTAVFVGHCASGPSNAYRPIIDILRNAVDRLDTAWSASISSGDLGVLLPDLAGTTRAPHKPTGGDSAAEQYRLGEAIAHAIGEAAQAPIVIVVEDIQWVDRPSLTVLRHLLRHAKLDRLVVVATCRQDVGPDLASRIEGLAPRRRFERLDLVPFDENEVRALVRAAAAPDAVHALVERTATLRDVTGGSPFLIRELLRELDDQPKKVTDSEDLDHTLASMAPAGVRALVDARMQRLSVQAREVLTIAAVLGRSATITLLARCCAVADDEAFDAVEECLAARLLVEDERSLDVFAFPHALIRNAVSGGIDSITRPLLHARIAAALEADLGEPRSSMAELAHHFRESVSFGSRDRAVAYATRAGHEAVGQLAFGAAAHWYGEALRLGADGILTLAEQASLRFALGRALEHDGQFEPAYQTFLDAAEDAQAASDACLYADIALAAAGPWSTGFGYRHAATTLLEAALDLIPAAEQQRRVELLNALATTLYYVDPRREERVAREAVRLAESLNDNSTLAAARLALHRALTHQPQARLERVQLSQTAHVLATEAGEQPLRLRIQRELLADLLQNGRIDEFNSGLDAYEHAASEFGSPRDIYWSMALRATQATLQGDLTVAEQRARGAELRGRALEQSAAGAHFLQRFVIRYQQARLGELLPSLRGATDAQPNYRAGAALASLACAETGHPDEAVALARRTLGDAGDLLPKDVFWLGAVSLFAGVAATTGDSDLITLIAELLAPYAEHVVVFGTGGAVLGCGHYWLGVLASAQDASSEADRHLTEAERIAASLNAPYWLAQARLDLADTLTRAQPGMQRRVERLRAAAVEAARRHHFDRITRQAAGSEIETE